MLSFLTSCWQKPSPKPPILYTLHFPPGQALCAEAQWGPGTCRDQQAVCEPHSPSQIPGLVTHPLVSHFSWCLQLAWGCWRGPVFGLRASAYVPCCCITGPDSHISPQRDLATPPSPSHSFTPAYGELLPTQSCCDSALHGSSRLGD